MRDVLKKSMLNKDRNWLVSDSRGFTFVEIIVVMAILGLLAVLVFMAVLGAHRGRRDAARRNAIDRYIAHIEQRASSREGVYDASCAASGWNDASFPCSSFDYAVNSECDASGAIIAGTFRSIAVRTLLENGTPYCQSTI